MIIYLDFDGVLFDTVSIIIKEIEKQHIDLKKDCKLFFEKLDWDYILINAKEISNSISAVNELKKAYNIKILTHVSSQNEELKKRLFINKYFKDIEVIFVPKEYAKSLYVSVKDNILIDDSKKNVDDWIKNGGIAYLYNKENIIDIIKGE